MAFTRTPELRRIYDRNYASRPATRAKLRCREQCAYAIKTGKLVRQPCENCGNIKSQAHHDDYSKPRDVRWLCGKCHSAEHRITHCQRGHAMTNDNIYLGRSGRQCLQCRRAWRPTIPNRRTV